jgi:hypothetical protein
LFSAQPGRRVALLLCIGAAGAITHLSRAAVTSVADEKETRKKSAA